MRLLTITLATALVCAPQSAGAADCPAAIDPGQMALDYEAFDQSGWRALIFGGCADAAIALLERYRETNAAHLTDEQTRELHFHVGQALALSGRDVQSIPHFELARGGAAEWAAYVEATISFLRRDAAALAGARARYAEAAGASPMRLALIDGFLRCSSETYARAVQCGMDAMHH